MTHIGLRDDFGELDALLNGIIRIERLGNKTKAVHCAVISYYSNQNKFNMLSDVDKQILASISVDFSKRKLKKLAYLSYGVSNIKEKIKEMCYKNVPNDVIILNVNSELKSQKFNYLLKKDINSIKEINNIKFYQFFKDKIQEVKDNNISKKQLLIMTFDDVLNYRVYEKDKQIDMAKQIDEVIKDDNEQKGIIDEDKPIDYI